MASRMAVTRSSGIAYLSSWRRGMTRDAMGTPLLLDVPLREQVVELARQPDEDVVEEDVALRLPLGVVDDRVLADDGLDERGPGAGLGLLHLGPQRSGEELAAQRLEPRPLRGREQVHHRLAAGGHHPRGPPRLDGRAVGGLDVPVG